MTALNVLAALYLVAGLAVAITVWRQALRYHGVCLLHTPRGLMMLAIIVVAWPFGRLAQKWLS
jgi:hypothetical protein